MKPVTFKHQTSVYAKTQPQYQNLPSLKLNTPEGEVIASWRLSFWERVRVLFLGRIWVSIYTFNERLAPSKVSTQRKDLYSLDSDTEKKTIFNFWKLSY